MIRLVCAVILICLPGASGCGDRNDLSGDIGAIVDAERRFARDVAERGVRDGFIKHLGPDAVLFRPRPVNGREWLRGQPETGALLDWEPVIADVSDAGDLGYTTGPWSLSTEGAGVEPSLFGHYVTVWKRTPAGVWQVAIDVGTVHDNSEDPPPKLTVPKRERRRGGWDTRKPPGVIFEDLQSAERSFAEQCRGEGVAAAIRGWARDDIRYCPPGELPLSGREAVAARFEKTDRRRVHNTIGGDVSRSGDLGYVYGSGALVDDNTGGETSPFCYLRIWTRGRDRQWKIALDASEPVPGGGSGDGE